MYNIHARTCTQTFPQQNLQEIQKVAQKLQSQLARRDSTSSLFRKSLSNTPTDSLLSSLDMSSHSAPVAPVTVKVPYIHVHVHSSHYPE